MTEKWPRKKPDSK